MANRAYVSIWTREYGETTMLNQFQRLLETVPKSGEQPGFVGLSIRAIGQAEAPLIEQDLRGMAVAAPDVIAIAREHVSADDSYEVETRWNLWEWDSATDRWHQVPERLSLVCQGEAYDDGAAAEAGHFTADIGFEHLFTGHGGLLGLHSTRSAPADPIEAKFLSLMSREDRLHEYYEKTQSNIRQLLDWIRAIEQALPIEHYRLWSEGEENLEARLDEILAVR